MMVVLFSQAVSSLLFLGYRSLLLGYRSESLFLECRSLSQRYRSLVPAGGVLDDARRPVAQVDAPLPHDQHLLILTCRYISDTSTVVIIVVMMIVNSSSISAYSPLGFRVSGFGFRV